MQKPSTLKRTAGKDQSAAQSVIETNRPAIRSRQNTRPSESKPGTKNPDHLILWVHRFHKTHKDRRGCDDSTPAILNYPTKFRSERCHCRDPMSPKSCSRQLHAGSSASKGKNRRARRRANLWSALRIGTSPRHPCRVQTIPW